METSVSEWDVPTMELFSVYSPIAEALVTAFHIQQVQNKYVWLPVRVSAVQGGSRAVCTSIEYFVTGEWRA